DAGDHRQGDARVARGRLDDPLPGGERAVGLGLLDHAQGDAVLHRPGGVLPLELRQDAHARVGAERADVEHRGVADQFEDRGVDGHGEVPEVGGRKFRVAQSAIYRRGGGGAYPAAVASTSRTGSSVISPSTMRYERRTGDSRFSDTMT